MSPIVSGVAAAGGGMTVLDSPSELASSDAGDEADVSGEEGKG
jgi:hypothetical protein